VNPDRSVTLAIIGGAVANNRVMLLTDSSGYNQPMEGSFETLVRAGDNNRFGGLVFVIPEPNAAALTALGACLVIVLRRRFRRS